MSNEIPTRRMAHYVAEIDEAGLGAVDAVRVSERKSNLWLDAWRDLRGRWMFWVSAVFVVLLIVVALFPGLFVQVSPHACELSNSNADPRAGHPLGFDFQGCDVYSRVINGTSTSLSVGIIVTIIIAVMGIVVGAFAGFFGGWVDSLLMRIGDMFFAIPYVLAAVVIMSMFLANRNILVISLAIGFFGWPSLARILRSEILRVRSSDFVMASEALGVSRIRTMFTHVLPNSIAPVIVVSTIGLAAAITAEATLSFLGVGLPGDVVSWGKDIADAQIRLRTDPMPLIYPSIALSLTVLSFIMLGETVRDALDPKARALR
ncbi:peptide ABC transporter permease [Microbacterium sp. CH12i]|uniref:ABC transporter permease n=1 Tax=Microbacterium sp. CH12i TaxID=1479651 RepID=UPI000460CC69|nr:ABC transporter permease [Microbacterium sp. CH12i]KDA06554.1 peptide ABC transporter permease [Microbacterium sp. CH12i]